MSLRLVQRQLHAEHLLHLTRHRMDEYLSLPILYTMLITDNRPVVIRYSCELPDSF